ncbi:MAG: hypothetical protein F6J89_07340 [Symploca sp. SIO1C4]|uniref:DUF6888 domain-containing protein n=1 Tax=Symploca sp. SIO1C4 TaxID=2607765 RepID=A0A6B3NCT2_9CYAN|nr:hypothetical protein [Symploca sp. SIO1C4]NET06468.1 hypothetical protein [Symploca sp. SIO2B6]
MDEPNEVQLRRLYRISYRLTNVMLVPIHIIRIDERTGNIFVLAGYDEGIELEITPNGEVF